MTTTRWILAAMLMAMLTPKTIQAIETEFFPCGRFVRWGGSAIEGGWIKIWAVFEKREVPRCEFSSIHFSTDAGHDLRFHPSDTKGNRHPGVFEWSGMRLEKPNSLPTTISVSVKHQSGGLWNSYSPLFKIEWDGERIVGVKPWRGVL